MVEHCTAGKDRTGVFSAILLTALGVPRSTVVQDYLLSKLFLLAPDAIENTAADLQLGLGLPERPDLATVKTIMTSKPETLEATLDKIDETYGSFANYLQKAAKLFRRRPCQDPPAPPGALVRSDETLEKFSTTCSNSAGLICHWHSSARKESQFLVIF